MVISYKWGQKEYRIPYATKKLVAYMVICVALFGFYSLFQQLDLNIWINRALALTLLSLFGLFIINVERSEFQRLPYVGRFFGRKASVVG
jgi:hypothetical protein